MLLSVRMSRLISVNDYRHAPMRRLLFILLTLLCTVLKVQADDSDYYVESWDYLAIVHENNTWDVRERIDVNFVQPHHGIFVYKPQIFTDTHPYDGVDSQYTYKLKIKKVDVPGWNFETETNGDAQDNFIIQIGKESVTLTGLQSYVINYSIVYPDDRVKEADHLYHSVLGEGWASNIRHFAFDIRFDKPLPYSAQDSCLIYSGGWNSLTDEWGVASQSFIDQYSLTGSVDSLPAYQAITVRMTLPEGYFVGAKSHSPWLTYTLYALTIFLGLYLLSVLVKVRIKRPVPSVEFYPPDGINSAEVGTIIDNSADVSDLVSLIPWFAEKGYITIEEKKGSHSWSDSKITLRLVKALPESAPDYQKYFMSALFSDGTVCEMDKMGDRHVTINSALTKLKRQYEGTNEITETNDNIWFLPLMLILMLFAYATDSRISLFDFDKFTSGIIFAAFQYVATLRRIRYSKVRAYQHYKTWISGLVVFLMAALHIMIATELYEPQNHFLPLIVTNGTIILCYLVLLLSDRFYTDSNYRIETIGKLLGFREFIKTAEKDRLEMLVKDHPTYFYDVLPYAMVFGLASKWAKKFKAIDIDKPSWYSGTDSTGASYAFTGSSIASSLSHSLSNSVTSAVSTSSHSPSSSSGGSGGGGGGGGGGAW